MNKLIILDPSADSDYLFNCDINKIQNFGRQAKIHQIEIVWDSLSGTFNGELNVYQESKYSTSLIEKININNANDSKLILLNNYIGKIRVEYKSNLIASGNIKFIIYWRNL